MQKVTTKLFPYNSYIYIYIYMKINRHLNNQQRLIWHHRQQNESIQLDDNTNILYIIKIKQVLQMLEAMILLKIYIVTKIIFIFYVCIYPTPPPREGCFTLEISIHTLFYNYYNILLVTVLYIIYVSDTIWREKIQLICKIARRCRQKASKSQVTMKVPVPSCSSKLSCNELIQYLGR